MRVIALEKGNRIDNYEWIGKLNGKIRWEWGGERDLRECTWEDIAKISRHLCGSMAPKTAQAS